MKRFAKPPSLYNTLLLLLSLSLVVGCEIATLEIDETEFFIAKEWKIKEAYRDEVLLTNEILAQEGEEGLLENFRLIINEDFTYTKITFDKSSHSGIWQLSSGKTQLTLISNDPTVDPSSRWLLDLEIRRMELTLIPGGEIGGRVTGIPAHSGNARVIYEPVRGQ